MLALAFGALALWRGYGPQIDAGEWAVERERFPLCGSGRAAACVVDGDTLHIGQRRIRLTGYDAPELDGTCAAEQERARIARAALAAWLNAGPFELDGGADPPRDKYGRELRAARRVGSEGHLDLLAEHMVAADLAAGGGWFEDRDWCAT